MHLLRTIAVAAVAIAVAILPLAGSAAVAMGPAAGSQMLSAMPAAGAGGHGMHGHDDCPEMASAVAPDHHHGAKPCGEGGHCPMMAFCAAMSVGIAGPADFAIDYPVLASNPLPFTVDDALTAQRGSPPFEPPRV